MNIKKMGKPYIIHSPDYQDFAVPYEITALSEKDAIHEWLKMFGEDLQGVYDLTVYVSDDDNNLTIYEVEINWKPEFTLKTV